MTRKTLEAIPLTYGEAVLALRDRLQGEKTIGHNTRLRYNGSSIELVHHSTVIARYYPRGAVALFTDGYRTVTTKARLDRIAQGAGFRLGQEKGEWLLVGIHTDTRARFFEGVTLGASAEWVRSRDDDKWVPEAKISSEPPRRPLTSLLTTPANG